MGGMVLTAALLGSIGLASGPSGALDWTAAAGCPDATTVEQRVDELLVTSRPSARWSASGRIDASAGGYWLELEVSAAGRREHRQLRARDCAVLTEAAALMVAVTVDALATAAAVERTLEPPAPTPAPEPPPPARASVPRPPSLPEPRPPSSAAVGGPEVSPDDDAAPSRERRTQGGTVGAGGGVAIGLNPAVTGGVEVELGWRLGALRLVAAGYHWASTTTTLQPGAGVESALSGGLLRSCLALTRGRVEVPLCLGLDLGVMHGGGVGDQVRPRPVRDLWVGLAAGGGVTTWISRRFAVFAQGEIVLGARRPAMYLDVGGEPREAFRVAPVGARLLLGPLVSAW